MIRRNLTLDGNSSLWLLIPQTEHARIAYELARNWGVPPLTVPEPATGVPETILRHDDGWRVWEQRIDVDPQSGRPLSFTEMPPDVAHAIWQRSIIACSDLGPLAQHLVAEHFMHLRSSGDSSDTDEAAQFLREFQLRSDKWLLEWQRMDPQSHTSEIANRALEHLQLFDAMSLWFSCAERTQPREFDTPDGIAITLTPLDSVHVSATPWPLSVPSLQLCITGRVVPARAYEDAADLDSVPARQLSLTWELAAEG